MKNLIAVTICLVLSIAIVIVPSFFYPSFEGIEAGTVGNFNQTIEVTTSDAHKIYKLYEDQKLIGIIKDKTYMDEHLNTVYKVKYASMFPNTHIGIADNMYLVEEMSTNVYTDVDAEIMQYLDDHSLYSIACKSISFSDNNEEYARIFVKSEDIYQEALQKYLSYFIDEDTLEAIHEHHAISNLTEYGVMTMGFKINETIQIADAYASVKDIKTTEEEVLHYLSYGDNENLVYYTVEEGDTLDSIGLQNYGLTAEQLLRINQDVIKDGSQPLTAGTKLCVTYFTSPIDVYVYKQRLQKETLFYKTSVLEDNTVESGQTVVRQSGANGSKNVLYHETWVNGVLKTGTELSSVVTAAGQDEVVAIGKNTDLGIGSGSFAYPVEHPEIICEYGCYAGFESIDFINRYNRWGNVMAADTGVIKEKGYTDELGNYVIIDHHNGYQSVYGHLYLPCALEVDTVVRKGDVIGKIGMTGKATGPHVTFSLLQNGKLVNACSVLMDCEGLD